MHPAAEILLCHPCTPVDRQHLSEVDGIYGNDDIEKGQKGELTDEWPERCPIIRLQCVIEYTIPVVDADEQIYHDKIERDD